MIFKNKKWLRTFGGNVYTEKEMAKANLKRNVMESKDSTTGYKLVINWL